MSRTTVMVVDDETDFVETITKRLEKRDLQTFKAHSGPEALKTLRNEDTIEAVILDVKMPEWDGVETLKRIKADYPLEEVIMLTGHATVESAVEGMKRGAFDYLVKPADMDDLMEKINAAVKKKRDHEEKIAEAKARSIALRRGD